MTTRDTIMQSIVTICLLAAVAVPAAAQDREPRLDVIVHAAAIAQGRQADRQGQRQGGREQSERTSRTLKLGANGELHLANIAGDMLISRGGGNDVTIEIVKTARGRDDEDARQLLQLVQVEIIERSNRAEVRTRHPQGEEMRRNNRRNFNVSVAYNVVVPAAIRLRAHSISGSITAKDVKGDVSLESVSGVVRVFNGGRISSARSISGNVEISDSEIDGPFSASTASGSVLLRHVKARQLDLGSISGNVFLDDVECSQIEAQTVSGDVRFGGPVARGARYELSSHSGNVSVAVAGTTGFEVEATSFSGGIRSDFPFAGNDDTGGRGRRRHSMRGVHGDGSAVLDLTTFSGDIVISKR